MKYIFATTLLSFFINIIFGVYWKCDRPKIKERLNIIVFNPLTFEYDSLKNGSSIASNFVEQCTCALARFDNATNLLVSYRIPVPMDYVLRCYLDEVSLNVFEDNSEENHLNLLTGAYFNELPHYAFNIEPSFVANDERCKDLTGRDARNLFHLRTCFTLKLIVGINSTFMFAGNLLMNSLPTIPYETHVDAKVWNLLGDACESRISMPLNNTFGYIRNPAGDKCVTLSFIDYPISMFMSMCCCTANLTNCDNNSKQNLKLKEPQIQCVVDQKTDPKTTSLRDEVMSPEVFYGKSFSKSCYVKVVWHKYQSKYTYTLGNGANEPLCGANQQPAKICPIDLKREASENYLVECCTTTDFCNFMRLPDLFYLTKQMLGCPYGDPRNLTMSFCFFYYDLEINKLVNIDETFLNVGSNSSWVDMVHADEIEANTCYFFLAQLKFVDPDHCQTKLYHKNDLHSVRTFEVCTCNIGDSKCMYNSTVIPPPYNLKCKVVNLDIDLTKDVKIEDIVFSGIEETSLFGCALHVLYEPNFLKFSTGGQTSSFKSKCFERVIKENEELLCEDSAIDDDILRMSLIRVLEIARSRNTTKNKNFNVCRSRDLEGNNQSPEKCIYRSSRCYSVRLANSTFTTQCNAGCTSNIIGLYDEPDIQLLGTRRQLCESVEFIHNECFVSYPSETENPLIICCTNSAKTESTDDAMFEISFGRQISEFV